MDGSIYMCIDLKSFFASVECADMGLDPFSTNLVVADPSRGSGAICLAITPAMKALGIRNRCRVFEIPEGVRYITALPRMRRYMEVSAQVYGVYLRFVSPEDIHVYSIDECFIDATPYLGMYGMTPKQLAKAMMDAVFEETHICATAGIGTNLFLAKVALDITAKHVPDHIGWLDEREFHDRLRHHRPITDFWNVGSGTARRLAKYGVYDMGGVAEMNEAVLYKEFGVNAEFLIDHSHGREPCTMADIHAYQSTSKSISNGQILFEDYTADNALIVLKEMVDTLVLELVEKKLAAGSVSLTIGYSKDVFPPTGGTRRLTGCTGSRQKLTEEFIRLFNDTTRRKYPIRSINIALGGLADDVYSTFDLFMDPQAEEKEKNMQNAIIDIKRRFGKNSLIKAASLQEKATGIRRNNMVGGHNGG
ncbi:MAG: DNA repair protein [Oscillospiraceae bacterium]|nr:DNA repair protein [Oscillospiraceae bacterium]